MKHISKKRQPVDGLLMILIFSLVFSGLFQVVLAFSNQGVADVMTFNYVWATTPIDNIFHLYSIPSLDYPPLVPVLFRLITPVLQYFSASASTFLLMKLFPIAFNLILGIAVYVIVDKKQPLSDMDKALAVVVATFSPTLLFNAAIWGQFDGLLVLLLFLCFYSVSTKRIYWASAFYAIGCLTKLQFCYFIFPFAAIVILFYPLRKIVIATLEGLAIGLLGWLPFMVVSGPSLPLRIYLGGSGKYPFLNLSAFNTWGIFVRFGVNLQEVDFPFGLDAGKINIAIILICALITAILIAYIKRTVGCLDVRILTLLVCLFYNTVFIISTQQHERYQIPVIAFLLIAVCVGNKLPDRLYLLAFTALTFLNEVMAYHAGLISEVSQFWFNTLFKILSFLDVVLSVIFTVYVIKELRASRPSDDDEHGERGECVDKPKSEIQG